jgi:hypothetical protein
MSPELSKVFFVAQNKPFIPVGFIFYGNGQIKVVPREVKKNIKLFTEIKEILEKKNGKNE